jgi:nucleoside-diphosphate-sugar epimerase|tara:strand:+ start:17485 stop:18378 length:894 start_codon:yes stop_codon:yes gene_type:complete
MKIKSLVTGGLGFIGSNLVDLLVEEGHEVSVIDDLSTGYAEYAHPQVKYHTKDIRKYGEIEGLFEGMDYVFHLAALPRVEPSIINPMASDSINTQGSLNVFFAAKEAGVKKVIFSSSSSIYGDVPPKKVCEKLAPNPLSPYGLQKLFGEQYLELFHKLYGLDSVSLRYFNVYGNRQPLEGAYVPVVGIWFRQIEAGGWPTITGDGNNSRDFVNVKDVARANLKAAIATTKGHSYFNIGSGTNNSLNDLCDLVSKKRVYIDPRIEPRFTLADTSKAKKILNWSPEIDVIEWIKQNQPC